MMGAFDYHRPADIAEAISLKRDLGDKAVYWAGGTDLVLQCNSGKAHVGHCIDLTALQGLSFVESVEGGLCIGALTPLSELERLQGDEPHLRTIREVASLMCTVQTRTIATLGGNLCNASPSADLFVTLAAMGATARVAGSGGTRDIPLDAFMLAPGTTSLAGDEMLTEVFVPTDSMPHASAYRRIARTVVDIALVSAAASLTLDRSDGTIRNARVTLGAVAPRIIRATEAEDMLNGRALADLTGAFAKAVGTKAAQSASPITDIRASAGYRKDMVAILVARCLSAIAAELGASPCK
jgi:carbon-monoxide dehydrogenase medium subunit